jgi:hypothetical protein
MLLLSGTLSATLVTPAYAQQTADAGQAADCQRPFVERATPYLQQMLWYADQSSNYPLTPQARPLVTSWPYSAYGPGNGYGPGSPYGPVFGPWGVGSFGPGFGGPYGYGLSPYGVGGPPWLIGGAIAGNGAATLATLPPGLAVATLANQRATAPGGLAALSPADQIALASLAQSLSGNVLSASSLGQSVLGNQTAEAGLRQAVIANRLSAGTLNATLASYPSTVANNLGAVISAIQGYASMACPSASNPGPSGSSESGGGTGGPGGNGPGAGNVQ